MSSLLHSAIALGLWATRGSYGRVLSEPTQRPHIADHDRPPAQTHMVEVPELRHLAKRQETSSSNTVFTITMAPDETCGWLSGSAGSPITCENHRPCMWADVVGIICGAPADHNWDVHITCYQSDVALNTSLCPDTCQSNRFFLRCTDASAPYCRTYAYPDGIEDFRCASTPVARPQSVSFTYDGQNDAAFRTSTYTDSKSRVSSIEPVFSTVPPPPPPPPPPPKHVNIGAIVGGAVGGFVVLSLIAFAIFWFVRRPRTLVHQGAPPMQVDPMEQVPPTGTGPNAAKASPSSPVQSEWRDSMMTVLSSGSNPASPQPWGNQPVSPGGQSATSQGVPQPATHDMSGGYVQPQLYEMAGDPAHPQVYGMMGGRAHPRVYELTGDPAQPQTEFVGPRS